MAIIVIIAIVNVFHCILCSSDVTIVDTSMLAYRMETCVTVATILVFLEKMLEAVQKNVLVIPTIFVEDH